MGRKEAEQWLDRCINADEEWRRTSRFTGDVARCGLTLVNEIHLYQGIGVLCDLLGEKLLNDGHEMFFFYNGYRVFQLVGV